MKVFGQIVLNDPRVNDQVLFLVFLVITQKQYFATANVQGRSSFLTKILF